MNQDLIPGRDKIFLFFIASIPAVGPTYLPVQGVVGPDWDVKAKVKICLHVIMLNWFKERDRPVVCLMLPKLRFHSLFIFCGSRPVVPVLLFMFYQFKVFFIRENDNEELYSLYLSSAIKVIT
jgi:hypothetical protein